MSTRAEILVTATEVTELRNAGDPLTILDVRWSLAEPDGRGPYTNGHIPGAVYVSLEDDLSDHGAAGRGRHPLPTGSALEAAARRWGIRRDVPVVVYDDWNRAGSARAWWVLTAAGIPGVRILDGGLSAWVAAGGALETGTVAPAPGDVTVGYDDLYAGARRTLTADEAASATRLIDARAPDRFRGEVEPVDAVAGHIPGATNLPSTRMLRDSGEFLGETELVRLVEERGVVGHGDIGVYCGSGVTAAVVIAALAGIGVDAALFPGSWSEWSAAQTRPVARGSG